MYISACSRMGMKKQHHQRQGSQQTNQKHTQPDSSRACLITGADNLIRLGAAMPRGQKRTKACLRRTSLDSDIGYTACFPKHHKSHPSRVATMHTCRIRARGANWRRRACWRLNGRTLDGVEGHLVSCNASYTIHGRFAYSLVPRRIILHNH